MNFGESLWRIKWGDVALNPSPILTLTRIGNAQGGILERCNHCWERWAIGYNGGIETELQ